MVENILNNLITTPIFCITILYNKTTKTKQLTIDGYITNKIYLFCLLLEIFLPALHILLSNKLS